MNDKENKKETKKEREVKKMEYNYMILDRLRADCEYYLGNGNRHKKHLWTGNEEEQIKEMKRLYDGFTDDQKPEWLTWEQILEYEKQLVTGSGSA